MATYAPQKWVVVKLTNLNTGQIFYKILAGFWDTWRISSQIISCGPYMNDHRIEFSMSTGSNYICHPEDYGLNNLTSGIFDNLVKEVGDRQGFEVSIVDGNNTDFINKDFDK